MKKNIKITIITILLIAVVVLGAVIFIKTKNTKTTTAELNNQQLEINMTENISNNNIVNNQNVIEVKNNKEENINQNNNNNENTEIKKANTVQTIKEQNSVVQNEIKQKELQKNENVQKQTTYPTGKTKYYIKVNYGANAVTIYGKDENGYYSKPIKAMVCSCGTATPKGGVYKTSKGYEWGTLEGGTYGRYSTRIVGGILFHSVPYISESEDSLEYWEYDKLGTTASLGCVRLTLEDTKWIFDNCEVGTQVEFYTDQNPGPLGKPSAKKISDNVECRNWDPTDTSPNSPWNK